MIVARCRAGMWFVVMFDGRGGHAHREAGSGSCTNRYEREQNPNEPAETGSASTKILEDVAAFDHRFAQH